MRCRFKHDAIRDPFTRCGMVRCGSRTQRDCRVAACFDAKCPHDRATQGAWRPQTHPVCTRKRAPGCSCCCAACAGSLLLSGSRAATTAAFVPRRHTVLQTNSQQRTQLCVTNTTRSKQLHGAPREQRNTFAPACNPVAGNDVRRVAGNDVRAGQRDVEMAICAPARAMYTTNCERSRVRTVSRAQGLACVLSCVRAGLPSAAAASARLAACGRVWPQV